MGELHLEILHSRLKSDFKVDADLGKMMVAYKETISTSVTQRIKFERKFADQKHFVEIELEILPKKDSKRRKKLNQNDKFEVRKGTSKEAQEVLAILTERKMRHIENGVASALNSGPKLGFPVSQAT